MRQLEAHAVHIDNLDRRIALQVLAQLGDIHIHRTGGKVAVILPDALQRGVAVHQLVEVHGEYLQQVTLLGGEPLHLLAERQRLVRIIEGEVAN